MRFDEALASHGLGILDRCAVQILQINVGKVCNQACQHCHVDAGPRRQESMTHQTARRVLDVLDQSPDISTVDITGGAPELNPNFRLLVEECRGRNKHVIDRCNLTILLQPGFEEMPEFLAQHKVEVIASLPCYTAANVALQRGRGVFEKSIEALQKLNRLEYGIDPSLHNLCLQSRRRVFAATTTEIRGGLQAAAQRRLGASNFIVCLRSRTCRSAALINFWCTAASAKLIFNY